jgi:hypothetical protein
MQKILAYIFPTLFQHKYSESANTDCRLALLTSSESNDIERLIV